MFVDYTFLEGQGNADGRVQGRLHDATTLKAGYLTPVEKVVSAHLCISVTAHGIVNYCKRLLAPAGSMKPKAILTLPAHAPPLPAHAPGRGADHHPGL